MLVRNYDYAPSRLEGVIWHSRLLEHQVIGMSDCLWGLLDGMNDAGLSVSLTFGGRRVLGDGFGIPLVVRYLLEMCETTAEAREILARLPYHLAHNLTIIAAGWYRRRSTLVLIVLALVVGVLFVEWPEQARATRTLEREQRILELLQAPSETAEGFADAFLSDALYSQAYDRGFGTLYTAVYRPAESRVEYRWPGFTWPQSFAAFSEGTHEETLAEGSVA